GLDFFSENLWPFKLRDNHLFHYQLQPRRQEPQDEALRKGGILRNRGQSIGVSPNGPPPVGPPPPVGLPPAGEPAPPGRPGVSGPGGARCAYLPERVPRGTGVVPALARPARQPRE